METYNDYKDIFDSKVIARILGVRKCPVDKLGQPLVNIRRQRVYKVLPHDFFGVIFSPRLEICDENGIVLKLGLDYRGIDDMTYKTHSEIQRICPRAYSIFLIFRRDNEQLIRRQVMHGYYKFGGSARDEDTNISTSDLFQQADLSKTQRVVITEKANGKAAVMSMFKFNEELYFFGGSKGDHYVTLAKEGMRFMQRLNRNLFAYYIFDVFFRIWDSLSKSSQEELIECLCGSEPGDSGYTLCAEYEDGRHMVPLPLDKKGNMVNDGLKFFGLVRNLGAIRKGVTLCEDVMKTLKWFARIGLPQTPFYVKKFEEFRVIKENLRRGCLKEGYVIHYQMKNSAGEYVTIGVEKFKIWWYIVLRLLREFMRRKKNIHRRRWAANLWNRLKDRNECYMKMTPQMLKKWYNLLCKFVNWFFEREYNRYVELVGFESGSLGMGTMWREFLFDYPNIDDTFGFEENPIKTASIKYRRGEIKSRIYPKISARCLVIFQGIPGLGKTNLGSYLIKKMKSDGINAINLEQDMFVEKFGLEKSGTACIRMLEKYINSGSLNVIFLLRNNASPEQFDKHAKIAKRNNWQVHVMTPKSIKTSVHLLLVCLQAVYCRSKKKDHPSFKTLTVKRQLELTLAFFAVFKRAKKSELVDSVSEISWLKPESVSDKLETVLCPKTAQRLIHQAEKFYSSNNPYKITIEGSFERWIDCIKIRTQNYQIWRKTPELISLDVVTKLKKSAQECTSLVKQAASVVSKKASIAHVVKDNMTYIALMLDSNSQEILTRLLRQCDFNFSGLDTIKLDHLTMIYGNKTDPEGAQIWKELLPIAQKRQNLGIIVKGVAFWPRNLICFTAEVRSKVSYKEGKSLLKLVFSRHPHITALTAKNVLPVESIKLLKYLAKEEAGEGRVFLPLRETILLCGEVTVVSKTGFSRI